MRTLTRIRTDLERELSCLAQAYLYGTPEEVVERKRAVARLAEEERGAARVSRLRPEKAAVVDGSFR